MSITRSISSSVVLLKRFRNGSAGIVYQNVEVAKGRDGLLDGGFAGVGFGGVRLDHDRLSAVGFNLFNHRRGRIGVFRVGNGLHSLRLPPGVWRSQRNAARAARYQCIFSFQFPIHDLSPVSFEVEFILYRLV